MFTAPGKRVRPLEFEVLQFDTLPSTNSWLKEAAESGRAREGTVVVAAQQTAGRGRLGRIWVSEPGEGLLFSLLLAPALPESHMTLIGLLTAMGVMGGIAEYLSTSGSLKVVTRAGLELRWPNDILSNGRKLCGVLCEACQGKGGCRMVVVGIGINVNQRSPDFPAGLRTPATSLHLISGATIPPSKLLPFVLEGIRGEYDRLQADGWEWIAREWEERAAIVGREVEVQGGARRIRGVVREVISDGALLLNTAGGDLKVVRCGDCAVTCRT